MTIYTAHNAAGCTVHDVDTLVRIDCVLTIDTIKGVVTQSVQPTQLDHTGEIASYETRYRSIYPIFGGQIKPLMFHCYGKIE